MPPEENVLQKIEVRVTRIIKVGTVDRTKYPLPKSKFTLEFLRNKTHLRFRTDIVSTTCFPLNQLYSIYFELPNFFEFYQLFFVLKMSVEYVTLNG